MSKTEEMRRAEIEEIASYMSKIKEELGTIHELLLLNFQFLRIHMLKK